MTTTVIIALIGFVVLGLAAVAFTRRNLIHAALLLAASWLGLAALYLAIGAEFVAFAQVLVYVGAISMVVLFAVLLTRQRADPGADSISRSTWARGVAGIVTAAIVAGVLCAAVMSSDLPTDGTEAPTAPVKAIGLELMGSHLVALMVAGVVLTVALIGGVILAATEKTRGDGKTGGTDR